MNKIFLLINILLISGCASYENRFGSNQHKYADAVELSTSKLPKTAMPKGDYFSIPRVGSKAKDIKVSELPPSF